MDRRGAGLAAERALIAKISAVYEQWGFEPLETSAFEYADALGKFRPDQDRPNEGVFALQDDDEQWLALRYDLTAPLARFVAENFDALPKPYRRWAAGPVWRNEKPGPGRFREFWQCDADTVGSGSPAADAEMIAMACAALEAAGVPRGFYQLKVNDRKILDALLDAAKVEGFAGRLIVMRALDKLDRLGRDGVVQLLGVGRKDESGDFTPGAKLSTFSIDTILMFLDAATVGASTTNSANSNKLQAIYNVLQSSSAAEAAAIDLGEMLSILTALGLTEEQWAIDTSIVRGLEYYTGAVFEAQLIGEGGASFGSVGGGGRYDDLVSRFRGEKIPATGFSVGVSRLAAALEAAKQNQSQADGPIVVLVMDKERIAASFEMAAELRNAGIVAEVYLGAGGMKAQLKYADKRAAPIAIIQGGDEAAKGTVTLKDLKLGARIAATLGEDREAYARARERVQREVARADLVENVRQMLDEGA
jgi:histidyl-tRNA synthetase